MFSFSTPSARFHYATRTITLIALALTALTQTALATETSAEESVPVTTYALPGLEKPAEIIVDHWGVPHIYAGTHYDAFFVQGFNAARDRLWQIDLWRLRGLGLLSEAFGPEFVEQDRAARLFLYRGDMYPEWLAYGSDAKKIAESFTAGINAYVQLLGEHPELMPPEFELLGYKPSLWDASDVVRIRSNGLWRNVASEVRRSREACDEGLEATLLSKVLQPEWQTEAPEGFDPCSLPEDVIDDYLLATAPVNFKALAAIAGQNQPSKQIGKKHKAETLAQARTRALADYLGSNNWVVAPSRTDTGRPILADDPHRGHAVPSLRYIAHLSAPGLDVIGAGEPALPGISIGHNERIAFGLTIFPIDHEDLYVYERTRLKPRRDGVKEQDRTAYRYQGRAEGVRTVEELIPVKGESPRPVQLSFTRHGPIVAETKDHLYAIRAAWLEPGMAPYFGSVEYMRAQNWREFVAALNRWGAPSENQVYADVDGNIGYKPAGLFPKRTTWDGLWPVPGDGRYEWEGFFDMDVLPEEYNPERGFSGTANSMNLPDDYPIAEKRIGFEWSAPWRYKRLWEVLEKQPSHSLTDSHDLQRDYQSVLARQVLDLLPDAYTYSNHQGLAMLKDWDAVMAPDSAAAALYGVWFYRHLPKALLEYRKPGTSLDAMDTLVVLETLADYGSEEAALRSLEDAWYETSDLLGPNPWEWQWGDLHQIVFEHPLKDLADDDLAEQMAYRPYPRGGTSNTTNNTGFRPKDFKVIAGASFRMVLDVGQWDDAEMTNAPGQSGDPRSLFYDNLLEGWATDSSFPLLYSRNAVEANQALRIVLEPANQQE